MEGMVMNNFNSSFFAGKKILITGHTGFKGSWLSRILYLLGSKVYGFSLSPETNPNLYQLANIDSFVDSTIADIRDFDTLYETFRRIQPEIVIHLAAQPLVRVSYKEPRYTYETNVMGTVNLLECLRLTSCVRSFLNVTTDKVYKNNEWCWGYRENDVLDGFEPYSNSKSCSELVTRSYRDSFFSDRTVSISTARAGNVIGGGDFSLDRIIPDCVRAQIAGTKIVVRNPNSIRPYQHVLEPLFAYLMIIEKQFENINYSGSYNVGPDERDCVTTGRLVDLFCGSWKENATWVKFDEQNSPHEANFLKLDCSRIKDVIGWKPVWHIETAVDRVCEWTKNWLNNGAILDVMDRQIEDYLNEWK